VGSEEWNYYSQLNEPIGIVVAAAGTETRTSSQTPSSSPDGRRAMGTFLPSSCDANGQRHCNSNFVSDDFLDASNVVGFNGDINVSSGSSFSAARVAWLLAGAESLRTGTISLDAWNLSLKTRLKRLRAASVALQSQ